MKINIADVIPPTEKQVASNIHGTVNLSISAEDGTPVVRLNGISVRKAKDGNMFLAMPTYRIGSGPKPSYYPHFKLFPGKRDDTAFNEAQRARSDELTATVLKKLKEGGTRQVKTATAPATSEPSITVDQEPWS